MHIPLPSLTRTLAPISDALDQVDAAARRNWMRGLSRGELRALCVLGEQGEELRVDHFCDSADQIVIHEGQNSLPLFTTFQKRICRNGGVIQGYNHNPRTISWFTGPGHFTVIQDGKSVVFDYTALPTNVPDDFPPLSPNDTGTANLVFGGMTDRVHRVSKHCTIGRAYRKETAMNAWFMLAKET